MVAHLGCAQPAVSRHLRVLREAALITDRRKGKEVEYSLRPEALAAAAEHLEELAKAGAGGLAMRGDSAGAAAAKPGVVPRAAAVTRPRKPARGLAGREAEYVIKPRRKSGLDDFLL
jgi:DNA-binding MarR family transcriptional regulator